MPRLAGLAACIKVLESMRRELGTGMVNELEPAQLYRVRRYVEKINEMRGVER